MEIDKNELKGMLNELRDELKHHVAEQLTGQRGELKQDMEHQRREFQHFVGVMMEDVNSKLQLVAEGHQMLSDKFDRAGERLEKKIDAVATDLAAHRLDTEGHQRGYIVSEP
jgi:hypothetical protein